MIIVLSDKKTDFEDSFTKILHGCKAAIISDSEVTEGISPLCVVSRHKTSKITMNKGAVVLGECLWNFKNQHLPSSIIGICSENNLTGLKLLKSNNLPIITCGMGRKNTLTVSSNEKDSALLCLQRSITDINGNTVEPCEIKVLKKSPYNCYSLLAATAVMLIYGIKDSPNFIW